MGAAPTVTFRDAGELSTAAFHLDVAHPTGFPLEMVLFRLAQCVPLGDVAFRTNVTVGLVMALAAAAVAALAQRALSALPRRLPPLAEGLLALGAPLSLACAATVLRAATAAEVYASALALPLGALVLAFDPRRDPATRLRLGALLASLSLALHTTARPGAFLAFAFTAALVWREAPPGTLRRALKSALWLSPLGLLALTYLPLAARRHGPINWQDPSTLSALVEYLSARSIRASFAHRILVPWRAPEDLAAAARVLVTDLGPATALFALFALLAPPRGARPMVYALAALGLGDLAYAALINPMGLADRQTLFFAEASLVVLAAVGLARLVAAAPARLRGPAGALVGLAVMGHALARADLTWAGHHDGFAVSELLLGPGALGRVPVRAVVLCASDDLCGAGLYAQWVEGERPDVVMLPRQHLALPFTWQRLDPRRTLARRSGDQRTGQDALRRARLGLLAARFAGRLRYEGGDLDGPITALGAAETPCLADPAQNTAERVETTLDFVTRRLPPDPSSRGIGARYVGATTLFAAGQRLARHDLDAAERLWREALSLYPEHVSSYTNLGVAAARRGDLPRAVALTRRAVTLDPERPAAWRNLAEFESSLGHPAAADEALREARRREINSR